MVTLIKLLVLPPCNLLLLGLWGLWLRQRHIRLGNAMLGGSLALLYLLATPLVSGLALGSLEAPYVDPAQSDAQAIVVLGGGTVGFAPEFGADNVNHLSLVRARYGARLHRSTGKPVLVSGGSVSGRTLPEARQMATLLREDFDVPVQWLEEQSRDTFTNALESQRILQAHGIRTIYLVTHAWHMPRARLAFEHAGFRVVPAPTGYVSAGYEGVEWYELLPRASSLLNSYYFCHEVLGYLVYSLRTRF